MLGGIFFGFCCGQGTALVACFFFLQLNLSGFYLHHEERIKASSGCVLWLCQLLSCHDVPILKNNQDIQTN